jgi:hypothetical protein
MHWAGHDFPKPDRAGLRHFGLVTGLTVIGLFGLALPWLLKRPHPQWPWVLGGLLVASALIIPKALRMVYGLWMRLALLLNRLTTPLIAAVVFFLCISPAGWIMRMAGRDPMARRLDHDACSYRVPARNCDPSDMDRPF